MKATQLSESPLSAVLPMPQSEKTLHASCALGPPHGITARGPETAVSVYKGMWNRHPKWQSLLRKPRDTQERKEKETTLIAPWWPARLSRWYKHSANADFAIQSDDLGLSTPARFPLEASMLPAGILLDCCSSLLLRKSVRDPWDPRLSWETER